MSLWCFPNNIERPI